MHEAARSRTLTALVLGAALLGLVTPVVAFDDAGFKKATATILCDCGCHPQSVHACACGRAAEMREEIHGMIAGGMSGDDVIAAYVAKHGDVIRIAPEARGFNLVAWLGPLAALLAAFVTLLLVLRRWSARQQRSSEAAAIALPAEDDPYMRRLRSELEELR